MDGVRLGGRRLTRKERSLYRAKRGSGGGAKRRIELATSWRRVSVRARGALHARTTALVKDVTARFAIERLRVKNMVKNHNLALSIHEQQWGSLVNLLVYKAKRAGGGLAKDSPSNTSQICIGCGHKPDARVGPSIRAYRCGDCRLVLDRDVYAARNILQRGLAIPKSGGDTPACGKKVGQAAPLGALHIENMLSTKVYNPLNIVCSEL